MKNARLFRQAAEDSASPRRPAVPASSFQFNAFSRAALLAVLAGAGVAAVARHHGWLVSLGGDDNGSQRTPARTANPQPESAAAGTFTRIDVSGAGAAAMEGTFALAINTAGEVTGIYSNAPGTLHGFVRDAHGAITKFDGSSSGAGAIEGTIPLSIDTAGEIAGTVIDSNHVSHGFVRNVNGSLTEFEAPGAGTAANRGTVVWRINDAGEAVGFYSTDGGSSAPPTYHGFLRKANGAFTILDDPDAGSQVNEDGRKQGTQAYSINNAGTIVGSYVDSSSNRHAFLYAGGKFTNFDAPGALTSTIGHQQGLNGTLPTGIDADGVVAGTFTDSKGRQGFIRTTEGSFEIFNGPAAAENSAVVEGTIPFNIGLSDGVIVGFDSDGKGFYHAFERSAAGVVSAINPPGAGGAGKTVLPGAGAGGVNEFGDVAGGYSDANGVYHGFIFSPASTAKAATPAFLPKQGTYVGPQSVQIKDATIGAAIYYTLDNSIPPTSKTSKKYTVPISITKKTTIKAVAVKSGFANSSLAAATYTILKAQSISWPKIAGTHTVGSTLALKATATSGLPVSFASTTAKICTVVKTTASLLAAGNCTIHATQAGNAVYGPAPPVSQTIAVKAK